MAKPNNNGLTPSELDFWERAFLQSLPDCLRIRRRKGEEYCAHIAAEVARASIAERRRATGEREQS